VLARQAAELNIENSVILDGNRRLRGIRQGGLSRGPDWRVRSSERLARLGAHGLLVRDSWFRVIDDYLVGPGRNVRGAVAAVVVKGRRYLPAVGTDKDKLTGRLLEWRGVVRQEPAVVRDLAGDIVLACAAPCWYKGKAEKHSVGNACGG